MSTKLWQVQLAGRQHARMAFVHWQVMPMERFPETQNKESVIDMSVEGDDEVPKLSAMVQELYAQLELLGEDTNGGYRFLRRARNVLESGDPAGMKNLKRHLMMDFRMIDDRGLRSDALDDVIDRIYRCVSESPRSHE